MPSRLHWHRWFRLKRNYKQLCIITVSRFQTQDPGKGYRVIRSKEIWLIQIGSRSKHSRRLSFGQISWMAPSIYVFGIHTGISRPTLLILVYPHPQSDIKRHRHLFFNIHPHLFVDSGSRNRRTTKAVHGTEQYDRGWLEYQIEDGGCDHCEAKIGQQSVKIACRDGHDLTNCIFGTALLQSWTWTWQYLDFICSRCSFVFSCSSLPYGMGRSSSAYRRFDRNGEIYTTVYTKSK